jgi:CIC family chloride channel protein
MGKFSLIAIAVIFVAKFFATPFCFGSGAAGGIFLPMLMLGSFLGYFIGIISVHLGIDVNPVIVAFVGMGAFLAATARTPITAMVMVFEMTGNYNHILPIMFAVAIADLVAEKMHHSPIYSELILRQAKPTPELKKLSSFKTINVADCNFEKIMASDKISIAKSKFEKSKQETLPVLNARGFLVGSVSNEDIDVAILQGISANSPIEKIMDPEPKKIRVDDDIYKAFYIMHLAGIEQIFVINKKREVIGIITMKKLLSLLND